MSFFSDICVDKSNIQTGYAPLIRSKEIIHLPGPIKLNEEDIKVLEHLRFNSRDSLEEISSATSLSSTLVDYKLRKFLSSKLITYFATDISYELLGYEKYILLLNMGGDMASKEKIISDLRTIREAYSYFEFLNYWELAVTFCVKSRENMYRLISELLEKYKSSIRDHDTLWLIKEHKSIHYPCINDIYDKNQVLKVKR